MHDKKILIVDESCFSRVCSAILRSEGFFTNTMEGIQPNRRRQMIDDVGLVIMSYPYGIFIIDDINKKIPVIILSDQLNREVIDALVCFDDSYCMIKPLDYEKFKTLVRQIMNGERGVHEGYCIV